MKTLAVQVFFLVLVLGGGSAIGLLTHPGEWYAQLAKPSFNPPSSVFAPVWSFLYVLIAVAGCRTWLRDRHGTSMKLWDAQLLLNFIWTPVFFAAHRIDAALAIIVLLLASIVVYIIQIYQKDRISAVLFVPYLLWVAFATALNMTLWWIN